MMDVLLALDLNLRCGAKIVGKGSREDGEVVRGGQGPVRGESKHGRE